MASRLAAAILAFHRQGKKDAGILEGWVCKTIDEEDYFESMAGEIYKMAR
jgi:hypothetical protein